MTRNPYLTALGAISLLLGVVGVGAWVLAQMTPELAVRAGMVGFGGAAIGAAAVTALAWLVASAVTWKQPD